MAAVIVFSCFDVKVVKYGNRSIISNLGLVDILEKFGIDI